MASTNAFAKAVTRDVPMWLFTDIPIANTVQNIKTDKHNRSDLINISILLCISSKNKIWAIPQAEGFIICEVINAYEHLVKVDC